MYTGARAPAVSSKKRMKIRLELAPRPKSKAFPTPHPYNPYSRITQVVRNCHPCRSQCCTESCPAIHTCTHVHTQRSSPFTRMAAQPGHMPGPRAPTSIGRGFYGSPPARRTREHPRAHHAKQEHSCKATAHHANAKQALTQSLMLVYGKNVQHKAFTCSSKRT